MLNTFIPRPSYTKWIPRKESIVKQKARDNSETSSEESDYYGTETEKSIRNRPKANLKIGRLSTVKEVHMEEHFFNNLKRANSGKPRKFTLFQKSNFIEITKRDIIMETDSEFKSDYSSILNANFGDNLPPLEITKSIELKKGGLKHFNDNELTPAEQHRMLYTP
jgi:hypothetical protein